MIILKNSTGSAKKILTYYNLLILNNIKNQTVKDQSYNLRVHSGGMILKSWFGVEKHNAVIDTGLIPGGVYRETDGSFG